MYLNGEKTQLQLGDIISVDIYGNGFEIRITRRGRLLNWNREGLQAFFVASDAPLNSIAWNIAKLLTLSSGFSCREFGVTGNRWEFEVVE